MKTISRTIYSTTVNASTVSFENGGIKTEDLKPLVFEGEKVSEEKALKAVVKAYGKENQYIIKSVDVTEEVYEIDFDVFMKHAKKIEKPNVTVAN